MGFTVYAGSGSAAIDEQWERFTELYQSLEGSAGNSPASVVWECAKPSPANKLILCVEKGDKEAVLPRGPGVFYSVDEAVEVTRGCHPTPRTRRSSSKYESCENWAVAVSVPAADMWRAAVDVCLLREKVQDMSRDGVLPPVILVAGASAKFCVMVGTTEVASGATAEAVCAQLVGESEASDDDPAAEEAAEVSEAARPVEDHVGAKKVAEIAAVEEARKAEEVEAAKTKAEQEDARREAERNATAEAAAEAKYNEEKTDAFRKAADQEHAERGAESVANAGAATTRTLGETDGAKSNAEEPTFKKASDDADANRNAAWESELRRVSADARRAVDAAADSGAAEGQDTLRGCALM